LTANGEALEAMKEDILASKNTLIDARDAIAVSTEKISQQNKELEVLKGKLQESQAKNNQVEQQSGSVTVPVQPRRVITIAHSHWLPIIILILNTIDSHFMVHPKIL
jgi:hypothetical protein